MATSSKKKVAQHELRRIMSEQKRKLLVSGRKIDSPLAKYKEDGTLACIVCESTVRSDAVWIVHINSKQHKDNIARKKQLLAPPPLPPPDPPKHIFKRPLKTSEVVPPKKIKGILKNAPSPKLPEGFFESDIKNRPVPPAVAAEYEEDTPVTPSHTPDNTRTSPERIDEEGDGEASAEAAEPLPEGFFDDPFMDAKARNVEYKDPIQEEWEKFQKEIKEETTVSTQIIEDDQEEATAERQIQEIDEQLRNWSRVLDLEKKKETVQSVATKGITNGNAADDPSDEDEEFDEFLDWRAKKSFK